MKAWLIALLVLGTAAPLAAQEWLVNREQFSYIGTRLTIEVATEAAGSLQLIRGQPGIVRVAGRVPRGFAASGLSQRNRLTLSAAGEGPVDYLVAVPEGVWVNVRLPDRHDTESVGGHTRLRTFDWAGAPVSHQGLGGRGLDDRGATDPELGPTGAGQRGAVEQGVAEAGVADAGPPLEPGADDPVDDGLFTGVSGDLAPATIAIADMETVRRLTVRTGADRFRIATSRPMSLEAGDPHHFQIRPVGEPIEIAIDIPAGTADFTLLIHGATALTVIDGSPMTACTPVTQQWLSGGRRWFTFTPMDGRIECADNHTPRRLS